MPFGRKTSFVSSNGYPLLVKSLPIVRIPLCSVLPPPIEGGGGGIPARPNVNRANIDCRSLPRLGPIGRQRVGRRQDRYIGRQRVPDYQLGRTPSPLLQVTQIAPIERLPAATPGS